MTEDGQKTPPCTVAVSWLPDDYGLSLLGDSFLRKYVASFDYAAKTVTIGKSVDAPRKPTTLSDLGGYLKPIIIICVLILIIIVAVVITCVCCKVKGRDRNAHIATAHYQTQAANAEANLPQQQMSQPYTALPQKPGGNAYVTPGQPIPNHDYH